MGRMVAGSASGVRPLFPKHMRCDDKSIPDRSRPVLPTTASGVARQGTFRNYASAGLSYNKRRKGGGRRVKRQQKLLKGRHTHNNWYLKYRNNDWKRKRAGRHDEAKECRYILWLRKQSEKRVKRGTLEVAANYSTMKLMEEKMG